MITTEDQFAARTTRIGRLLPNPDRSRTALLACGVAVASLVVLAACGSDTVSTTSDQPATSTTAVSPSTTAKPPRCAPPGATDTPKITAPGGTAPTTLQVKDLTVGTGTEVATGSSVSVDYIGAKFSDGKVFDQSYGRAPFSLTVGAGSVIKGWDQGLVGMKVGGRRELTIPPDLAYGAQAPGDIGANQTLIFVIDLRWAGTKPVVAPAPGAVTALQTTDLLPGAGDCAVQAGDKVTVHYVGIDATTGTEFDASWKRGQAFETQIGVGAVIKGWDEGMIGMKVGGRRRLVIPASLAYGAAGSPPAIAPNATLVFEVDLLAIA